MVAQLRMYRAKPGELDAFVDEWRRRVVPLRRRAGFSVLGAWTVREEERFVWIIACEGDRRAFEARDAAYYASPDRTSLRPDPARHLAETKTWIMDDAPR